MQSTILTSQRRKFTNPYAERKKKIQQNSTCIHAKNPQKNRDREEIPQIDKEQQQQQNYS